MVNFKLIYFDLKARGQLTRMIFETAGVKFEDDRIGLGEWASLKPKVNPPFGQLPILEVDGVRICQSLAVARTAARETGLAGKTSLEQARADMAVECINELFEDAFDYFLLEKDETRKEEKKANLSSNNLPRKLGFLEKIFDENPGDWFVGKDLTWADLAFFDLCDWVETTGLTVDLKLVPQLQALRKRVDAVPAIANYIAKRKPTKF